MKKEREGEKGGKEKMEILVFFSLSLSHNKKQKQNNNKQGSIKHQTSTGESTPSASIKQTIKQTYTMKVPLPISTAIASIQWKLSNPSSPMYYEPIESLKTLRHTKDIPPVLGPIIYRGIYETIDDLTLSAVDGDDNNFSYKKYNLMLALGLILLGNGYIDEAHDLITPLSWSEDTYFGGPTMVPQAEVSVVAIASYAHSLLHRREGYAMGEFGMIGYHNAKYWSNAALSASQKLEKDSSFVYPSRKLKEEILRLSHQYGSEAELWCREHIGNIGEEVHENHSWDPRVLHDLAAKVSKGDCVSQELLRFAESTCEIELRLLLEYCLECAGYDAVDVFQTWSNKGCISSQSESLDLNMELAQRVANRVSAAHIDVFQSNGSVTLRKVLTLLDVKEEERNLCNLLFSAASGLACRLLGSPAVRCVQEDIVDDDGEVHANDFLYVYFPRKELDTSDSLYSTWKEKIGSTFYGGGDLTVGDSFCFHPMAMDPNAKAVQGITEIGLYRFLPCEASDNNACFQDRFYGSRGDTPTSVIQWSKGTIHKSI